MKKPLIYAALRTRFSADKGLIPKPSKSRFYSFGYVAGWSSGRELAELKSGMFKDEKIQLVGTTGGGSSYWEYCIHQIEMIVTLMGVGATRLMQTTGGANKHVVIEYADGRIAHVNYAPCFPETLMVAGEKSSTIVHQCSNFFPTLLDTILKFFNDRIVPIPQAETLEVAGIVGQSVAAQSCPNVWFDL